MADEHDVDLVGAEMLLETRKAVQHRAAIERRRVRGPVQHRPDRVSVIDCENLAGSFAADVPALRAAIVRAPDVFGNLENLVGFVDAIDLEDRGLSSVVNLAEVFAK